ncbi:hypothetical protein N7509_008229 [Penicillium cosmopolitanum]|uniref:Uncharacterized protein n=1 Tax=Penicillium cosmopolitanum TaxID=1131564 RepID=A0A9W9VM71_9EURO|nr:uncharacterized protein N7509_008229 [Penicillium cosmopolitanum]KAJ5385688.1 hypothetical protein N7509_008229 [Penicillium cosmopolitanum]
MRAVAPTEKLFLRPSPLTFLEPAIPAELCFLTKDGTDVHFDRKRESSTYVILTQYFPETSDARTMLEKKLKELAEAAIGDESVLTFYPLRHRTADVGNDEDQGAITVFERYGSHAEYEGQSAMVRELTEEARTAVERFEVSTWTDGVGHIRGKRITQT